MRTPVLAFETTVTKITWSRLGQNFDLGWAGVTHVNFRTLEIPGKRIGTLREIEPLREDYVC